MANSYNALYYHVVFSTKDRQNLIVPEIQTELWEYFGGVAKNHDMMLIRAGGIENHVHLLLKVPASVSISKAVQTLKTVTSKWINKTGKVKTQFSWQVGYGVFTVSKSNVQAVVEYIDSQREHHMHSTFMEEYRMLLERHGIEFDENFLWG